MSHDELLAEIDKYLVPTLAESEIGNKAIGILKALRAILELHKPIDISEKAYQTDLSCNGCADGFEPYPCPTIQAIEKELA